jgi:hypothetical protein
MDNTKRIPLVWNAKINTELLRNTAKNPGTNVPEFDVSCRNEMGENEKGETLLIPRDILLVWIDRQQQRLQSNAGIAPKPFRNLF